MDDGADSVDSSDNSDNSDNSNNSNEAVDTSDTDEEKQRQIQASLDEIDAALESAKKYKMTLIWRLRQCFIRR